jgi:hypothetical protein
MAKDYFIVNEEPNVNILGLDPIILAFHSDELKRFAGRNLSLTFYELENAKFRFGSLKKDWMDFSRYLLDKIESDSKFEKDVVFNLKNQAQKIYKLCKQTLERLRKDKTFNFSLS